jgi:hypothetical protein
MKGEIDIEELKRQLQPILPLNSGGSYNLLWKMLYHIRLLKYISQPLLKTIDSKYQKICSLEKLKKYEELDLLKNTHNNVFVSSNKSLRLLKQLGFETSLLPKNLKGEGDINELNNTEVFIQALKLPNFKILLYPSFGDINNPFLIPDALLIRLNKDSYTLEFLEIEASKPNWLEYIDNKKNNYLTLANSKLAYSYWLDKCYHLGIKPPDIKDFKFSVTFVGKIKKDFGVGFNFVDRLV